MGLVTVQGPAVEPVSLAELKKHLVLDADNTADDDDATALGVAAREWAEHFCRSRFITQQVRLTCDCFPGYAESGVHYAVILPGVAGTLRSAFALPLPPVQSIDEFKYVDGIGTERVLDAGTGYLADLDSRPARLAPPYGQAWPPTRLVLNSVSITYTVGYGDEPAAVPAMIKTQIKRLVTKWWEARIPNADDLPAGVKEALYPYRNLRL